MMFVRFLFLLVIIFSICVCFLKPKMHTQFLVYNSDYTIIETKNSEVQVTKNILEQNVSPEKSLTKNVEINRVVEDKIKNKNVKVESLNKPIVSKNIKQNIDSKKIKKVIEQPVVKKQVANVSQKSLEKKVEQKVLTNEDKDEIILWNIWHSNLQNSIMKDVKMPSVPIGSRFYFTFTVDKYGRITDIKTWCDNPDYNIYAIQYIAPVIRSYQGRSILNFPEKSRRVVTKFEGRFKISNSGQNKYSFASDFNDSEKIRK